MKTPAINFYSLNHKKSSNPEKNPTVTFIRNSDKPSTVSITYSPSFGVKFKNMPLFCPGCGIKMVSQEEFSKKLTEATLSKTCTKAIKTLKEFEKSMHPTERACFKKIKKNEPAISRYKLTKIIDKNVSGTFTKIKDGTI